MSAEATKPAAIPSAGADMARLLAQDVVIGGETAGPATGAQRIEPTHSPRATLAGQPAFERAVPRPETAAATDLHREVEQFLNDDPKPGNYLIHILLGCDIPPGVGRAVTKRLDFRQGLLHFTA